MKTFIILSLAVLLLYLVVYFLIFRKVPTSLSDTYYLYQEKYGCGYVFMLAIFLMGGLLMPAFIELSEGSQLQFLSFLCPASIIFVGAAPRFKDVGMESKIHPIAAAISAVCGCLWIILVGGVWWTIAVSLAVMIGLMSATKSWKSYTFWGEMAVFLAVYVSLMIL